MRQAIGIARAGIRRGQTPFGACVVKKGQIVARAHNTVWQGRDITAHAEINAIRRACRQLQTIDLSGCTIFSTCEPCPMCFSACHWARISRIVFGVRIEDARRAGFNELTVPNTVFKKMGGSPMQIEGNFLRKENLGLFVLWTKQKGHEPY